MASFPVRAGIPSAKRHREPAADVLKGAAILLVVLGHAIQGHVAGFEQNWLFRVIYSFHMPLFVAISGWFAAPEKTESLKKKSLRLIVPTVAWYAIHYWVGGLYRTATCWEFVLAWVKSPDVGLWFLWVLFLCHCWLALAKVGEGFLGWAAYPVSIVALWLIPVSALGLKLTKYYFVFFALSYLVARQWTRISRFTWVAVASAGCLYAMVFPQWQLTAPSGPVMIFANHPVNIGLVSFSAVRLVAAACGVVLFAAAFRRAASIGFVRTTLGWLGTKTMEIYVVHQEFVRFGFGSGIPLIVTSGVVATSLSLGLASLLKRSVHLSSLLYGSPAARPPRSKAGSSVQSLLAGLKRKG